MEYCNLALESDIAEKYRGKVWSYNVQYHDLALIHTIFDPVQNRCTTVTALSALLMRKIFSVDFKFSL